MVLSKCARAWWRLTIGKHCTLTEYSRIAAAAAFCQTLALFSALFVVCLSLMCLPVDSFAAISATCQRQLRQPGYEAKPGQL